MRRIGYILATIGYIFFFGVAMIPTLCIGAPLRPYALMTGFAVVAVLCGVGAKRLIPLLPLIVGLISSIHAYRYNSWLINHMREERRKYQVWVREETARTESNNSAAFQTNDIKLPDEPKVSPWNCCP